MKKPINLLLAGIIIIAVGAFFKILKFEYSSALILIGLAMEIFAGIKYFKNSKNVA